MRRRNATRSGPWHAGDADTLGEIWDDVIADLDSDWVAYAYAYVSDIGIGINA